MISIADLPPGSPPRMHCKRYRADISVATCLKRRKKSVAAGPDAGWGNAGVMKYDPECPDCEQGKTVAAEYGESVTFLERRRAPRKPWLKACPIDKGAPMPNKTCKRCGADKPLDEFYTNDSSCKTCRNKYSAARKRKKDEEAQYRRMPNYCRPERLRDSPPPAGVDTGGPPIPTVVTAKVRGDKIIFTIDCAEIMKDLREIITTSKRRQTDEHA